ncbi:unnamed protein product [Rhizoctonia solani]|uniref:Uncharacterized protein n=1 Tax=Rhizoctonia solani TaxID=456999 RepID=A0A8H3HX76_9AGAM|nr:unnamed protein product [Rhizoctonia solani]
MIREEYLFLLHMVHVILASTKGIDMSKTIDKQLPRGIIGTPDHGLTVDDPAESVHETASSQVNTAPPTEVTVQVQVEAAIDYATPPDNTENDNDTELLINELSNMSIDPTADDDALDEPSAPISSFLQEVPLPAMLTPIAVNTGITQLIQLQGAVQSLAQLPDLERAQLPVGIQQLFALFGNPSGPLGPISAVPAASSLPFAHAPNTTLGFGSPSGSPGPVPTFATTSTPPFVHAPGSALSLAPTPSPAPAPAPALALAPAPSLAPAPAPTPVTTATHAAHARASTQATQTPTASPDLPNPSTGTTAGIPQLNPACRESPSAKSQPLLTELFDDDGILSDASSATSPNENESSQAKPTTANAKTVARNTRSTTGATRGRGAGRGVGRGGGSTGGAILEPAGGAGRGGRGGRRGTATNASASATSRGKGKGKAVDNLDEFDKAPVVHASGSRRARRV